MSHAKKELAQIKNKQAARKYRDNKKSYIDIIEKQLTETERSRNELQLQNAGLKAENDLLKRQLQYFQDLFAKSQKSTASSSSQRDSNRFH